MPEPLLSPLLWEQLGEGVTVLDARGKLLFANEQAARICGFATAGEFLQASVPELLGRYEMLDEAGRLLPMDALASRRALQSPGAVEQVLRFRVKATGEERVSRVRSVALRDAEARVTHVLTTFRDITDQHRSEDALRFLAEVGSLFSSSLEVEDTLQALARAAVPKVADWCSVELVERPGDTHGQQVAVAHVDPAKVELARELRRRYPPNPDAPNGVPHVLRTGKTEYLPEIPDALLRQGAVDEEHYRIAAKLGLTSYVVVPLLARGKVLGALTLVTAESRRRFTPRDVELAEALAQRAALAVDNARLYEELRHGRERLELALAAGKLGAWEWDIRSGRVTWSPTLERIHGIPVGSFGGDFEAYQSDMHPEDKERVFAQVRDLLEGRRKEHRLVYRIIRPDGEVRWLEASGELLRDAQGAPLRLTGVCTDATERRAAEAAATQLAAEQAAHERTLAILGSITDPFFVIDAQGVLTYANARAAELLGKPGKSVLGEPFLDLAPLPLRERLSVDGAGAGQASVFELEEGEQSFEVFVYPSPLGRSVYCREITARRQAERELAKQTEELQRSNADLEQFAYVASHDLQEPLRMVASYTQLLARRYRGKLDSDADEFIGYAVDGVTRMQGLIQDLLHYSRVGTRGRTPALTPADGALDAALENLGAALQDSHATLTRDPLPKLRADKTQLVQLFQNLVGNSLKFRGEAEPRIHVGARALENGQWELSVRDNGIGIAPEYFDRVFIIFQRLHLRSDYPGNGIGLAICRKIVERHGGRIWISSRPGEGTTVHFTLPGGEAESQP